MMNYRDTLFFIGKCLTISDDEKNRIIVKQTILLNKVNWENVVKLSTKHYVFSALYCNLKRAKILNLLPDGLVDFMDRVTSLNRERNIKIIKQVININKLLKKNGITPIFIKGAGNVLEELYEDLSERMISDIDFIVSKRDYCKTIKLLISDGYIKVNKLSYYPPLTRHYHKLSKENEIAAIEIHSEILRDNFSNKFNYSMIKDNVISFNNVSCMSYKNQLCLSILAKQINDNGTYYKDVSLRNTYDVYLLSKKTNSLKAIKKIDSLSSIINNYLAISSLVLNNNDRIKFYKNDKTQRIQLFFNMLISNKQFRKKHYIKMKIIIWIRVRIKIVCRSFYNKKYRIWIIKRVLLGRPNKCNLN